MGTEETKGKDNQEVKFEEAMERLEEVIRILEEGNVPLEDAILLYEEGMKLARVCHEKLEAMKGRIDQISEENGCLKPFAIEEQEDELPF